MVMLCQTPPPHRAAKNPLFDGALAPTDSVSEYFYAPTPVEREKNLLKIFREIRDMIAEKLESTTLADIL